MVAHVVRCSKPCNNSNAIAWSDHWASGVWRPIEGAVGDDMDKPIVPPLGKGRAEDPVSVRLSLVAYGADRSSHVLSLF